MQTRLSTGATRERRVWNLSSRKRRVSDHTEPTSLKGGISQPAKKAKQKNQNTEEKEIGGELNRIRDSGKEREKVVKSTSWQNIRRDGAKNRDLSKQNKNIPASSQTETAVEGGNNLDKKRPTRNVTTTAQSNLCEKTETKENENGRPLKSGSRDDDDVPRFTIQEEIGAKMENRKLLTIVIPQGEEDSLSSEIKALVDISKDSPALFSLNARYANLVQGEIINVNGEQAVVIPQTNKDGIFLIAAVCRKKTSKEELKKSRDAAEDKQKNLLPVSEATDDVKLVASDSKNSSNRSIVTQNCGDSEEAMIKNASMISEKDTSEDETRALDNADNMSESDTGIKKENEHKVDIKCVKAAHTCGQNDDEVEEFKADGTHAIDTRDDASQTELDCNQENDNMEVNIDEIEQLCDSYLKNEVFQKPDHLKKIIHEKQHKRQTRIDSCHSCSHCGKKFRGKSDLDIHVRTHTGERPYACNFCKKAFSQKSVLKNHVRTHTGERPFVCDYCGKAFSDPTTLRVHVRFHTGERPYKCKYCESRFANNTSCKNHMTKHTGEKKFVCHLCGKAFSTSMLLNSHIRVHTGEKKYACTVCGRKFHSTRNRRRHMAIHTGKKKYFMCDICGKNISSSTNFNKHRKIHVTEKPFACDVCDKRFRDKKCYKNHVQAHKDRIPNVCPNCGKQFVKMSHLKRHMVIHKENTTEPQYDDSSKKPYECNYCNKSYKDRQCFKKHYMTHPEAQNVIFKCVICDKRFLTLPFLQEHVATHENIKEEIVYITKEETDNVFCCGICDETFEGIKKFEEHLQAHSEGVAIVHSKIVDEKFDITTVENSQDMGTENTQIELVEDTKPLNGSQVVEHVEYVEHQAAEFVELEEGVEDVGDVGHVQFIGEVENIDQLGHVDHIEQVVLEDGQSVQTIVYVQT